MCQVIHDDNIIFFVKTPRESHFDGENHIKSFIANQFIDDKTFDENNNEVFRELEILMFYDGNGLWCMNGRQL